MAGAIELPPVLEFSEPASVRMEPLAPRGCDAVQRVVRVVAGIVIRTRRYDRTVQIGFNAGRHAREHAASECAVQVERQAEVGVGVGQSGDRVGKARDHVARQAALLVTLGADKVHLAAFAADQHVRVRHVGAAREIEGDERNLAGTVRRDVAGALQQRRQVTRQGASASRGLENRLSTPPPTASRGAGHESLCYKVASGNRSLVIRVALGRIVVTLVSFACHSLLGLFDIHLAVTARA